MSELRIIVEPKTLTVRKRGPAIARVWMVIDGREFPVHGWSDFASVILGWWASALVKVLRGECDHQLVPFMDGPYGVEVSKLSGRQLSFRAMEGPRKAKQVALGVAPADEFIESVIHQGKALLEACRKQDWWSRDEDVLDKALSELERETKRGRP